MPDFEHGDVSLHYIEQGEGFPVLLFAPGGMRSAAGFWKNSPWNPVETLSDGYRVIAMDQRNAGKSRAPVGADDGVCGGCRVKLPRIEFGKMKAAPEDALISCPGCGRVLVR
jgi:pimeloyl-ACP methyl ester carboxylesterase